MGLRVEQEYTCDPGHRDAENPRQNMLGASLPKSALCQPTQGNPLRFRPANWTILSDVAFRDG